MIITAIAREIWTRMQFHAKKQPGELKSLHGLKVKRTGEFSINGDADLPMLTLVDLEGMHAAGNFSGDITLFLRTKRKYGWFAGEYGDVKGLYDWAELIMDAIETTPSGATDFNLIVHRVDGVAVNANNGSPAQLLSEAFTWELGMAEITELMFTLQLTIKFKATGGRRANRRESPVSVSAYADPDVE